MWRRNGLVNRFFWPIGWKGPKSGHVLVLDPKAGKASRASEARHAGGEATRVVTVNRTQHGLKNAHATDLRLHITQTKDCT